MQKRKRKKKQKKEEREKEKKNEEGEEELLSLLCQSFVSHVADQSARPLARFKRSLKT